MKIATIALLLHVLLLALFAFHAIDAEAADCTHGGKFSVTTCYGFEHAVITAAAQGAAGELVDRRLYAPVGVAACAGFFIRELASPTGAFGTADDVLDWASPCLTAYGLYHWRGKPVGEAVAEELGLAAGSALTPVIAPGYTGFQLELPFD